MLEAFTELSDDMQLALIEGAQILVIVLLFVAIDWWDRR